MLFVVERSGGIIAFDDDIGQKAADALQNDGRCRQRRTVTRDAHGAARSVEGDVMLGAC